MADQRGKAGGSSGTQQVSPQAAPPKPPSLPPRTSRSSRVAGFLTTWVFRAFTIVSISYLVYDRFYEMNAVNTTPASDPANPFYFPFSLTNSSHIFYFRDLDWSCRLVDVLYKGNSRISGTNVVERAHKPSVSPGGVTNIFCNRNGIVMVGMKMQHAIVQMQASYDVDIFGLFRLHRLSEPVTFTWMPSPTETQHQWIKGDL